MSPLQVNIKVLYQALVYDPHSKRVSINVSANVVNYLSSFCFPRSLPPRELPTPA